MGSGKYTPEAQKRATRRWLENETPEHRRARLEKSAAWLKAKKLEQPDYGIEASRKHLYGMAAGEYDRLFAKQKGKCAICRRATPEGARKLAVDHDHVTKKVRGLLCPTCNRTLGHLAENARTLRRAAVYLERYQESPANWPSVMIGLAETMAARSKDATTKVGAVVVSPDWKTLGTGFNGFPRGAEDALIPVSGSGRLVFTVHAEVNALCQAVANTKTTTLDGCYLFCTHRPCVDCVKLMWHLGIRKVYYSLDELSPGQVDDSEGLAAFLGLICEEVF